MGRIWAALKHRSRLRAPYLWARLSGELPLHDISGLFGDAPPLHQAIPNQVHVTWAAPRLGRTHATHFTAFRRRNPEYAFRFYDDAAIHAFMRDRFAHHPILPIFERGRFGPLKTDIWRYCILFEEGGVYCDIGKGLTTPLNRLIAPGDEAVISYERNDRIEAISPRCARDLQHPGKLVINWAMMFAPRHPFLALLIDDIVAHYPAYRGATFDVAKAAIIDFTGPRRLTAAVHRYVDEGGLDQPGGRVTQRGVDFDGGALLEMPGAYVRYTQRQGYALSRGAVIVD